MNPRIPDAELEIMKLLWERQPQSARELATAAYGNVDSAAMGTVQKLLSRLEAKGLVARDRSAHTHLFSAAVSRQELAGRQIEELVGKLTDGSLAPILMHLVKAKRLSPKDRDELRRLLDNPPRGA